MKRAIAAGVVWGMLFAAGNATAAEGTDLLEAVNSGEAQARIAAIDQLGEEGAEIEGAVAALVAQLDDESPEIRAHAARALGEIGPPAKEAAEPLAQLIFGENAMVRREATRAYRDIRPGPEVSIPLFARLFEEAEPEVRVHVMDALAEAGKAAVPAMVRALQSPEVAYWACLVLHEIGPEAAGAVPALCEVARTDDRPDVRREAVLALAAIGPNAAAAVPVLTGLLKEEAPGLTGAVVYALGSIGRAAKSAEPKVIAIAEAEDASPFLKTVCLWTRARMNPSDDELVREVIPDLVAALAAPEQQLREAAAQALLDLEPPREIVKPEIDKVLAKGDPAVLETMLSALATLGEKAVPRAIEAVEDPETRLRAAALIRRIGPAAKEAVPALAEALSDEDPIVRSEVLFALGAIGPDAAEAVPQITKALDDEEVKVAYAACYALGQIGPSAMEAKPALHEAMESEDEFLPMAAAWAVAQIHPDCPETAPKSVPLLIKALDEPDAMTRIHACESLECLGPLAKDAVEGLDKLSEDEHEAVREAAAKALEAIRK